MLVKMITEFSLMHSRAVIIGGRWLVGGCWSFWDCPTLQLTESEEKSRGEEEGFHYRLILVIAKLFLVDDIVSPMNRTQYIMALDLNGMFYCCDALIQLVAIYGLHLPILLSLQTLLYFTEYLAYPGIVTEYGIATSDLIWYRRPASQLTGNTSMDVSQSITP